MGTIAESFVSVFRDYVTAGVPASGAHEPVKSEIRAIGPVIESAIGTIGLAALVDVVKATRADLNADLAHAAATVALVYADATDANNDLYTKVGGSGSGSWTLTSILHDIVAGAAAPAVAEAEAAAASARTSAELAADAENHTPNRVSRSVFLITTFTLTADHAFALAANNYGYTTTLLDVRDTARRAAGGTFTFGWREDSGEVPVHVKVYEKTEAGATLVTHNLVRDGSFWYERDVTLNAATTRIQWEVFSPVGGGLVGLSILTYGVLASVPADPTLRSLAGALDTVANRAALVVPTSIVPFGTGHTYVDGVLTVPTGGTGGVQWRFLAPVADAVYTVRFAVDNAEADYQIRRYITDGNAALFDQLPSSVKMVVPGIYEATFAAEGKFTGGYNGDFGGLIIDVYNPDAASASVSGILIAPGYAIPPMTETPAVVQSYVQEAIADGLAASVGTVLAAPTQAIDLWGDSLVDFDRISGAPSDHLATYFGGDVTVQNLGIATQSTRQIAARAGGAPLSVSLTGDAIPAGTTAVALRNYSAPNSPITPTSSALNFTDPLPGTLGGIPGNLTAVRSGGSITGLEFTRTTAGSAVPITPDTPFYPTQGEATRTKYQVLIWGRNESFASGVTTGNMIADYYDQQVRAMLPNDKRFLVGSVLTINADPNAVQIRIANATIRDRFARYYVDLDSPPSTEEMATIGFTPLSTDTADIAAGFIPRGLRMGAYAGGDQLHLNSTGNKLWALRLFRAFTQRGWIV